MDTDNKEKTAEEDANASLIDTSVLDASTNEDDTLSYQTADEDNNSKYFSVIEGDSTLECSTDVTAEKTDLDIAQSNTEDEENKPSQLSDPLSNLNVESVNKLHIHERIDAANILSGGVDIFDDNENSVDEHELVIDDDAHPSEKSNDCTENSADVSGDMHYKAKPGEDSNTENNFNKHFELFKSKDAEVGGKASSQELIDKKAVADETPKDEEVQELDPKTDNYSALLQSNLPEGSSEATLVIDDKNVEAIDIGEGVFIYKNDEGELTAIQITVNEDGTTNFKCLLVGKNEDGNLEVYEEQVNQVPVTNEELESMKAKELSKDSVTGITIQNKEEEIMQISIPDDIGMTKVSANVLTSAKSEVAIELCANKDVTNAETNIASDTVVVEVQCVDNLSTLPETATVVDHISPVLLHEVSKNIEDTNKKDDVQPPLRLPDLKIDIPEKNDDISSFTEDSSKISVVATTDDQVSESKMEVESNIDNTPQIVPSENAMGIVDPSMEDAEVISPPNNILQIIPLEKDNETNIVSSDQSTAPQEDILESALPVEDNLKDLSIATSSQSITLEVETRAEIVLTLNEDSQVPMLADVDSSILISNKDDQQTGISSEFCADSPIIKENNSLAILPIAEDIQTIISKDDEDVASPSLMIEDEPVPTEEVNTVVVSSENELQPVIYAKDDVETVSLDCVELNEDSVPNNDLVMMIDSQPPENDSKKNIANEPQIVLSSDDSNNSEIIEMKSPICKEAVLGNSKSNVSEEKESAEIIPLNMHSSESDKLTNQFDESEINENTNSVSNIISDIPEEMKEIDELNKSRDKSDSNIEHVLVLSPEVSQITKPEKLEGSFDSDSKSFVGCDTSMISMNTEEAKMTPNEILKDNNESAQEKSVKASNECQEEPVEIDDLVDSGDIIVISNEMEEVDSKEVEVPDDDRSKSSATEMLDSNVCNLAEESEKLPLTAESSECKEVSPSSDMIIIDESSNESDIDVIQVDDEVEISIGDNDQTETIPSPSQNVALYGRSVIEISEKHNNIPSENILSSEENIENVALVESATDDLKNSLNGSQLNSVDSQSIEESEDDLEEDDYVDGEPVTGDSGVEWANSVIGVGVESNGNQKSITEVENQHSNTAEKMVQKEESFAVEESKVSCDKLSDSENSIPLENIQCLRQDISDNNNKILSQSLTEKPQTDLKITKVDENPVTEIDFDKFVRRNSIPLFEECIPLECEDVTETVKTKSVPVLEEKCQVEVKVNPPVKQMVSPVLRDNGVNILSNEVVQMPLRGETITRIIATSTPSYDNTIMHKFDKYNKSAISNKLADTKNLLHSVTSKQIASNDLKCNSINPKSSMLFKNEAKILTGNLESPSRPFANVSKLKTYSATRKSNVGTMLLQPPDQRPSVNSKSISPTLSSQANSRMLLMNTSTTLDANSPGKIVTESKEQIKESGEFISSNKSSLKANIDYDTQSSADESPNSDQMSKIKSRQPRKQVFTPVTRSDMEIIFPNLFSNAEEYTKESEAKVQKLNSKLKERDIRFKQLSRKDTSKSPIKSPTAKLLKTPDKIVSPVVVSPDPKTNAPLEEDTNVPKPLVEEEPARVVDVPKVDDNLGKVEKAESVSPDKNILDSPLSSSAKRKRGRPRKNPSLSDAFKLDDESPAKKHLLDKNQDSPRRRESPVLDAKLEDSPRIHSISPFGKINDNIKCPICFKTFRTENVLLKHVKHCNGVIDFETMKSPRKRKLTASDSPKQDSNDQTNEKELTENVQKNSVAFPDKSVMETSDDNGEFSPAFSQHNEIQKNVSSLSIVTPKKVAKLDHIADSVSTNESEKTSVFKSHLETITIEDSFSSNPSSPSSYPLDNIKTNVVVNIINEPNITEGGDAKDESSSLVNNVNNEPAETFCKAPKEKIQMAPSSAPPMSRLTKILNTKQPINCEICGKTFRQLVHMVYHRNKHTADEPAASSDAPKLTTISPKKQPNVEEVTENAVEADAMLKCEVCQKGFRKLHHLVEHRELHMNNESRSRRTSVASVKSEPEAGFRCDTCDKSFRKLHHLVEHRELHIAEVAESSPPPAAVVESKPAEDATCSGCGKSFRKRHHMVEHRDIHCSPSKKGRSDDNSVNESNIRLSVASSTSEEGNNCGICGKSYRKLHHMVEHRESHAEVREEKSKSLPEALNTKDIIHECSRCYMVFPNENSLNKHVTICSRKKLLNKPKSLQLDNLDAPNFPSDPVSLESPEADHNADNITQSNESLESPEKLIKSYTAPDSPNIISDDGPVDFPCKVVSSHADRNDPFKKLVLENKDSKNITQSKRPVRRSLISDVKVAPVIKRKSLVKESNSRQSTESTNASSIDLHKPIKKSTIPACRELSRIDAAKKSNTYSSLRKSTSSIESSASRITSGRRSTTSTTSAESKEPLSLRKTSSLKDFSTSKLKIPLRKSLVPNATSSSDKAKKVSLKNVTSTKHMVSKTTPQRKFSQGSASKREDDSNVKYMLNEESEFKYKINPDYKPKRRSSQPLDLVIKSVSSAITKPKSRISESALSGLKLPSAKMLKTIAEESTVLYSFPKTPKTNDKSSESSEEVISSTSQNVKRSITPKIKSILPKTNEPIRKNKKVISSLVVSHKKKSIGGRNSIEGKKLLGLCKKLQLRCCSQVFTSQAALAVHRKTHKATRQAHKCDCGKVFDTEGLLKKHIDTEHTPPKSYKCLECGASVRTAGQFAKHKQDHRNKSSKVTVQQSQAETEKAKETTQKQSKPAKGNVSKKQAQLSQMPTRKKPAVQTKEVKSPEVGVKKGVKRKIAHGGVPLSDKMRKAMTGVKF